MYSVLLTGVPFNLGYLLPHTISPETPPCTVPFSSLKLSGANQTRVRMWQISLSCLIFKHFHPPLTFITFDFTWLFSYYLLGTWALWGTVSNFVLQFSVECLSPLLKVPHARASVISLLMTHFSCPFPFPHICSTSRLRSKLPRRLISPLGSSLNKTLCDVWLYFTSVSFRLLYQALISGFWLPSSCPITSSAYQNLCLNLS